MKPRNPEYTTEVYGASLAPRDGLGQRDRTLWRAVVMGAINDLLTLKDSALSLKAFLWLFEDSEGLHLVCEYAEISPSYFRPRLAALLAINLPAAAQGQAFLVKSGQGITIQKAPKPKQQLVARYLLQRDEVGPVLAGARRLPESGGSLMARVYRQIRAMGQSPRGEK